MCMGIWTLLLLVVLAEALYLLYLGYIDLRTEEISLFNDTVREWNDTRRAEFEQIQVFAGEKEMQLLAASTQEMYVKRADKEVEWYLPLRYTAELNQTSLFVSDFSLNVTISLNFQVQNHPNSSEFSILPAFSVPTVVKEVEDLSEMVCIRRKGVHVPGKGCEVYWLVVGVCAVVQRLDDQWVLDGTRPGCSGKELNEYAGYERLSVSPGSQTPTLPTPATGLRVTVRSAADPLFAGFEVTGGSYEFGVSDTVYKLTGVVVLCVALLLLVHPICYFAKLYRDWRHLSHSQLPESTDDYKPSTPSDVL